MGHAEFNYIYIPRAKALKDLSGIIIKKNKKNLLFVNCK